MTVAPHPAAHRRSPSPPAARRNMSATSVRVRQSSRGRAGASPPRPSSRSKTADPAASPENNERRQPPPPRSPTVRDPQIPIGALAKRSPQPPRGFLLGRLSNAGPRPSTTVRRAGVRNPSPERSSNPSRRCWAWNRRHAVLVAPQRCKRCTVCAQERNVVIDRLGRLSQGPQLPSSACFSASFQISISKLAVGRGRPDTRGIDIRGIEHL